MFSALALGLCMQLANPLIVQSQKVQNLPTKTGIKSYTTVQVGKWHVNHVESNGSFFGPNKQGFTYSDGPLGGLGDYFNWTRYIQGVAFSETGYATTVETDAAISFVENIPEPWFMLLAYNAPHEPWHVPPQNLHTYGFPTLSTLKFDAAIQSEDTELKRLLDILPYNTYVIFIGDNGIPNQVNQGPFPVGRVKATVYEGGIHTPLIVAGPGVVPGVCNQFVSSLDIMPTIVELSHRNPKPNILFIVGDDLPIDRLSMYGIGTNCPPTPTLDALAASGVRFDYFVAQPNCSPTRSAIYSGLTGFVTGMGDIISDLDDPNAFELSTKFVLIPEILRNHEVPQYHMRGTSFTSFLSDVNAPPIRDVVFSWGFSPNGYGPYTRFDRCIRDARYKLIRHINTEEFYDMQGRLFEGPNLLVSGVLSPDAQMSYNNLSILLDDIEQNP